MALETLLKEIDEILREKNNAIETLDWRIRYLENENAELKNDIEKYKENEVNRV